MALINDWLDLHLEIFLLDRFFAPKLAAGSDCRLAISLARTSRRFSSSSSSLPLESSVRLANGPVGSSQFYSVRRLIGSLWVDIKVITLTD